MARERSRLVWGTVLLVFGAVWLSSQLHVVGAFGRAGLALLFLWMFGGAATALFVAHRADPQRRAALLLPAAASAALALVVPGALLRLVRGPLIPTVLFTAMALAFLRIYRLDASRRWALLNAWIFGVLSLVLVLVSLGRFGEALLATVFLWSIAAPFLFCFLRRGREGMLIPAGILFTAGFMPLAERFRLPEPLTEALFLLGLAGTFGSVWLLGKPGRVGWARWAALACVATAFLALFGPIAEYLLPVAFIAGGVWLILRPRGSAPAPPPPPSPDGPAPTFPG